MTTNPRESTTAAIRNPVTAGTVLLLLVLGCHAGDEQLGAARAALSHAPFWNDWQLEIQAAPALYKRTTTGGDEWHVYGKKTAAPNRDYAHYVGDPTSGPTPAWQETFGGIQGSPSLLRTEDDCGAVFWRTPALLTDRGRSELRFAVETWDDALCWFSYEGNVVWGTVPGGQVTLDDPTVTGWTTTAGVRVDVFSRSSVGNKLTQVTFQGSSLTSGSWGAVNVFPDGELKGAPAAVSWGAGRIDVLARGTDDRLYWKTFDDGVWSGWSQVPGLVVASAPAVTSRGPWNLEVFVKGTDGAVWGSTSNGGGWSPWRSCGGVVTSKPTATIDGSNVLVHARGTDGRLYTTICNDAVAEW